MSKEDFMKNRIIMLVMVKNEKSYNYLQRYINRRNIRIKLKE